MDSLMKCMETRYQRGNLEQNAHYLVIQQGKPMRYAGQYVGTFQSGSGDGMELHIRFHILGDTHDETDDMWGSISGSELKQFVKISQEELEVFRKL